MSMVKIKKGDTVQHIHGGYAMKVVETNETTTKCTWRTSDGVLYTELFKTAYLVTATKSFHDDDLYDQKP